MAAQKKRTLLNIGVVSDKVEANNSIKEAFKRNKNNSIKSYNLSSNLTQLIKKDEIDIVILNINDSSNYDELISLMASFKSSKKNNQTFPKFVMYTTDSSMKSKEKAISAGVFEYIIKDGIEGEFLLKNSIKHGRKLKKIHLQKKTNKILLFGLISVFVTIVILGLIFGN